MPRELNPELFGQRRTTNSTKTSASAAVGVGHPSSMGALQTAQMNMTQSMHPMQTTSHVPIQTSLHAPLQATLAEFEMADQYRKRIRDLENQVSLLTQKLEKVSSHFEQRFGQLVQVQKNAESQVKETFNEMYRNQAAVTSKLTERRVGDAKIQEMVDRHNQLVQGFEARMAQMHKVASEQEMKIMTYQATIDEILREIRNLKR